MVTKRYSIDFTMANGTTESVEFTVENGEDGKSAYDIAVENGFEGTEQEWADAHDPDKLLSKVLDALEQAEDMSV